MASPPDETVPESEPSVRRTSVWRADGSSRAGDTDALVVEEPLEVRVGERSLLFTEGLVSSPHDVAAVATCRDVPDEALGNVVTVSLAEGASLDEERTPRAGLMASACGVCGKASLEAIATVAPPVADGPVWDAADLHGLPALLRERQAVFSSTGGLHAAGLFDRGGRLLASAEDVGRHNTVDKLVGQAIRFRRLPLSETLLLVSGRAGFEIVQKARRSGIPVICSVSAPSSLAVDLARDGHQTLVGFLRDGRFNVYCGPERIRGVGAPPTREPVP
jgi:FdhD protein